MWLVPRYERTRLAREQRLAAPEAAGDRDRLAGLLARDAVLAERVRQAAAVAGLPVVEVPADPDWSAIRVAVEAALAPGLASAPRLAPGSALAGQRRLENAAAARQGQLWQLAAGLRSVPPYAFACECGRSRCDQDWWARPADYQRVAASRPVLAAEHR